MGETVGLDHAEDEKERGEGCRDVRGSEGKALIAEPKRGGGRCPRTSEPRD